MLVVSVIAKGGKEGWGATQPHYIIVAITTPTLVISTLQRPQSSNEVRSLNFLINIFKDFSVSLHSSRNDGTICITAACTTGFSYVRHFDLVEKSFDFQVNIEVIQRLKITIFDVLLIRQFALLGSKYRK